MLFTILIYGASDLADRLPPEEREALLQKHRDLQATLTNTGGFRGAVQLMAPSTARTVEDRGRGVRVLDGPFAESKEQIIGFYLVEAGSIEDAVDAAKALPQRVAFMEVRPVSWVGGL